MRFLRILRLLVKAMVNFKSPQFVHFDYIDVVIDDRPMLAASWKFKNAIKVTIKEARKNYWRKQTSIIIPIPRELESVCIVLQSVWRKRSLRLELHHYQLETTDFLIDNAKKPSEISTRLNSLQSHIKPPVFVAPGIALKNKTIRVGKTFFLKTKNLDYQNVIL